MIVLVIGSIIIAFVPALREYDTVGIIVQLSALFIGVILFALFSLIGYKIGAKAFVNVDL